MTVREDKSQVRMESQTVGIDVTFDPRGEVSVSVSRLVHADPFQAWVYTGLVGRASMERLLEIAGERMRAEGAVLRGDPDFFQRLGLDKREEAEAWTAFYAGRGPRPKRKSRLP